MAKRTISALLAVAVLLVIGYFIYTHYAAKRAGNGDVTTADVTDDSGSTVHPTPSRSDTPGTVNTVSTRSASNAGTQSASLAQLQAQNGGSSTGSAAYAPASDSQSPNAPNGAAFAGTGKFQVYRQGNLTWRVNTDNGSTCILFATDDEWRKPIVYNHGCGNS